MCHWFKSSSCHHGHVVQRLERYSDKVEVGGSNPPVSTWDRLERQCDWQGKSQVRILFGPFHGPVAQWQSAPVTPFVTMNYPSWPVSLSVRTRGFHPRRSGSIPGRATMLDWKKMQSMSMIMANRMIVEKINE